MPTELEELVEFLHHGNTQIRQIAADNLVGFSTAQPSLFKRNQLEPIKDLKLLIKDYPPIAKNALDMLINLSEDTEVRDSLTEDATFIESLLARITNAKEPNADLMAMLLANLTKSDAFATSLLTLKRAVPKDLSTSPMAIDQLLDLFVKGAEGSYNKDASFDYLCYLFADIAKHASGRAHFLSPRAEDADIVPLTKIIVFTEHKSEVRRRGVANTIKNSAFDTDSHERMLHAESEKPAAVNLLPYILLPLMGSEEYSDEDTEGMLEDLQLLDPDKERERKPDIVTAHLDTLLLLTTTREGRDRLRAIKTYPILRELHLQSDDEDVRAGADRVVQVIMRDEEGEESEVPLPPGVQMLEGPSGKVQEVEEDEEDEMVEVLA